jgi:hypothetical protein
MHVHLVREQVNIRRNSPDFYCKEKEESQQLQAMRQEVNGNF